MRAQRREFPWANGLKFYICIISFKMCCGRYSSEIYVYSSLERVSHYKNVLNFFCFVIYFIPI